MTHLTSLQTTSALASENGDRKTQVRIRLRIPKRYQQEPIISNLISQYGLTVNIAAALLSANAREDGWFDLDLQGTTSHVQSALIYLNDLDLEIWHDTEEESW
ncbi:MAG TPA: NIL domain-containing protein [Trichocoleus sp.]|jgi:ABC-type methionine transport system ATPase subunit